ncbi:hypothetical protein [Roseibium salinum]|uniref:Glycosyltransferase family 29 (Sialyltransferase) n=1 Tax=Roseibium salinum TaxID=1604349 RepID=A0ABT3R5E2_9HYPH|nr:hypothetical protein [Roseibium sp. DSM 29163]MCX2724330.1 hypothetical protein [Roseibium sp. DSM 29163]
MTSSILENRRIRTISIVGNGPVSQADAAHIDKADLVLRFNGASSCGAAGQRIDVLMLNRARVYMSKRINPVALHRASEVWVNDIRENGQVDWLFERECKPYYLGFGPVTKAREHLKKFDAFATSKPTSGASIIAEFLDRFPCAEIHLFGFTHQGAQSTHDWDAERHWIEQLCGEGRIAKHLTPGPRAKRSLKGKLEYALRFLEKRTKHYLFNKILHSSGSTKRRIYGK